MQIQHPNVTVLGAEGEVAEAVQSDIPDLFLSTGAAEGACGRVRGQAKYSLERYWGMYLGMGRRSRESQGLCGVCMGKREKYLFLAGGARIWAHDFKTDEVREVEQDWEEWQKELPIKVRCVAEACMRIAEWVEDGRGNAAERREWPTLGYARVRIR